MTAAEYLRAKAEKFKTDAARQRELHRRTPTAGNVLEQTAYTLEIVANALEVERSTGTEPRDG